MPSPDDKSLIILSMNEIDADFFAKVLRSHEKDAYFIRAESAEDIARFVGVNIARTRLISFCSATIVPGPLLEAIHFNAYNFHPGPPERPGYQPAPFAAHEKAPDFGATFHQMYAQVDTGPIVEVSRFALNPEMSVEAIEMEAYKALLSMVTKHARNLANIDFQFPLTNIDWSGTKTTRRDLERLKQQQDYHHGP